MSSKWLRLFIVAALVGALVVPTAVASAAEDADARVVFSVGQCDGVPFNAAMPNHIEYPTAATVYDFWGRAVIDARGYSTGVYVMENVDAWPGAIVRNTYILGSQYDDHLCGATGLASSILSLYPIQIGGNDLIRGKGGNDRIFGQDGDFDRNVWTPANIAMLRENHGQSLAQIPPEGRAGDILFGNMGDDYLHGGFSERDIDTPIIPFPPTWPNLPPVSTEPWAPYPYSAFVNLPGIPGQTPIEDVVEHGGPGDDTLIGGFGDDFQRGAAGNDYIDSVWACGRFGVDLLYGDRGDDFLVADALYGGCSNSFAYAGHGNDTVISGAGQNFAKGGNGDDTIIDLGNFGGPAPVYGPGYGPDMQFSNCNVFPAPFCLNADPADEYHKGNLAGGGPVYGPGAAEPPGNSGTGASNGLGDELWAAGDWMEGNLGDDRLISNLAGLPFGVSSVFTAESGPAPPFFPMTIPPVWIGGIRPFFHGTRMHDMGADQVWLGGDGLPPILLGGTHANFAYSCAPDFLEDEFGNNLGLNNEDKVYWGGLRAPHWAGGDGPGDANDNLWGFNLYNPDMATFDFTTYNDCIFLDPRLEG